MEVLDFDESWEIIRSLFPPDLDALAKETGFVKRLRGFDSVETITRLLLMHGSGLSLEQTAIRADAHGLARTSAVALHGRLKNSGRFFEALCHHVRERIMSRAGENPWPKGWTFRAIDATEVSEPGPTGSKWRVHYSLRLPDLVCDSFEVTDSSKGESLRHWKISSGEVVIADRAYSHRQPLAGLSGRGACFVVRFNSGLFPLLDQPGNPVDLAKLLKPLRIGRAQSFNVFFQSEDTLHPVRLCAIKKTKQAAGLSRKKARRRAQRDGSAVGDLTVFLADYVLVLSNLPERQWPAGMILDLYRCRWQVELAFKRLKSLLRLGHLPKGDPGTAEAWMHLKLLLALIIEQLVRDARFFSPWGYDQLAIQPLAGVQRSC